MKTNPCKSQTHLGAQTLVRVLPSKSGLKSAFRINYDLLNLIIIFILLTAILTACQTATPPPITAAKNVEFTLAEDQTASITDTGLTIRLIGVAGDQRCPSGMECAISGPVSVSLSVQKDNGNPININLQAFTGDDGRAATGHFEGIDNLTTYEGYSIQLMSVTPYPTSLSKPIKPSNYRVILTVTQE